MRRRTGIAARNQSMSREFPLAALRTADGGTNAAFVFAFASFPPGLVPGDYIADSKYGIEKGIGLAMVLLGGKWNPAGNRVPFVLSVALLASARIAFPVPFSVRGFRLMTGFSLNPVFLPWFLLPHVHSGFPSSFLRRNTCHLVPPQNVSRQRPHSLR